MYLRIIRPFFAISLALQTPFIHAEASNSNHLAKTSVSLASIVFGYNQLKTAKNAIQYLLVVAPDQDKPYLKNLMRELGTIQLPEARLLNKNEIAFKGIPGVLVAKSSKENSLSFRGKTLKFDVRLPIEKQMQNLEQMFRSEHSLLDFVLPQAHASPLIGILAVYLVGVGIHAASCDGRPNYWMCEYNSFLWFVPTTISFAGGAELPAAIACETTTEGTFAIFSREDSASHRVQLSDAKGKPLEINISNAPDEVKTKGAEHLRELCANTYEAKAKLKELNAKLKAVKADEAEQKARSIEAVSPAQSTK